MSNWYEGLIVEVQKLGVIDHPGVLVRNGPDWDVIHNSPIAGEVIMSSIEDFTVNRKLSFPSRYRPEINPAVIAQNARLKLGKPWTPFYNCQHFVSEVAGLKPSSHDLKLIFFFMGLGVLSLALRR